MHVLKTRSLRSRLFVILALLIAAAVASGALMVGLFQQSTLARIGQAEALLGRSCDAIVDAYRFYASDWPGPRVGLDVAPLRRDLNAVVQTALRNRAGVEGGIWQREAGSQAYAFPTYEGSGPKTDVPEAEVPRIKAINEAAASEDRPQSIRLNAGSQTLLLSACPLPGPIQGLTAWSMTRVHAFAGRSYFQLMAGVAVLLGSVLAAGALSIRLAMTWSRHVMRIEKALNAHDIADLPVLPPTNERELDRIVVALNEAGQRLAVARERAADLSRQVASGERLAAIGRVTAGLAHEIRNPIAAMRLKVETAIADGSAREAKILPFVLEQVARLDSVLRRLLNSTERIEVCPAEISVQPFLESCAVPYAELAKSKSVEIVFFTPLKAARFDPDQMRQALDNLILNAMQAAPLNSRVAASARRENDNLVFSVSDQGQGPPENISEQLFEPFVTGRPDGTGLGLSIVREVAQSHGGTVRFASTGYVTTFEIVIPWQQS
ncbi:MAG: HAMP domain-containing histidine kinase [Acidobacteriaceae bacterium]|nr:HAMP domain-containing histidine kinase [Acidobacteriaceae bacterium]